MRCMVEIETGVLPAGHPFARIGTGSRTVLYIPGLSFTAEPASVKVHASLLEALARADRAVMT